MWENRRVPRLTDFRARDIFISLNTSVRGIAMSQHHGMRTVNTDESVLISLNRYGPQTLDQLTNTLAEFTWAQIFGSVDRLSRAGQVVLKQAGRDYHVALPGISMPSR